eukprot:TRINITY_DN1416_c0_g2_i1.p1 TRINITY_DN1416_c0_g2~~TRINITY_DN1416_c0_g2_i1.p1  ORF type:complete len:328 (+),score=59.31 TRINITY_DN1416_c0_g2_i1:95-1078(+)
MASVRIARRSVRWCSEAAAKKSGLGAHFGAGHEHKESMLLRTFVTVGQAVESWSSTFGNSAIGRIISPEKKQIHKWGKAEVDKTEDGKTSEAKDKKDLTVKGVAINTDQYAVIPIGEVKDESESETGFDLFRKLLSSSHKSTEQQATDVLYKNIPDFSEPEFLEDVESKLLPAFLEAFWKKDKDGLLEMCSEACYHLNVEPHLKQYDKLTSNCKLLMTRRANLFNRLMFIDDSDHAPSVKKREEMAEKGIDLDDMDDLDIEEEKPEPVFFVSCSAHIENQWKDASGEIKAGDADIPEDWYFVFGLTPQPGQTWTMSTLEFQKMQAMA